MIVYGIKNCNTVKKALDWLKEHELDVEFHDYKKVGVSEEKIEEWQHKVPWESLINKRGTTWRKLTPERQEKVIDAQEAKILMLEQTSIIKRPIMEHGDVLLVGFDEQDYQRALLS